LVSAGWSEQDPHDWWRAATRAIRSVLATTGIDAGACYRTPARVLHRWEALGLDELSPSVLVAFRRPPDLDLDEELHGAMRS